MQPNRGKILNERLHQYNKETSITLTRIAHKAGYDQSTMYRHFKNPVLEGHIILRYGRAIEYDFSKDIPEIKSEIMMVDEPQSEYRSKSKEDYARERDEWREKYISLLEKHNAMLQEKLIGNQ